MAAESRFVSALRALPGAEILTTEKGFHGRWIGHPALNRWGLHVARIALSDVASASRRRLLTGVRTPDALRTLRRDGVVTVPEFLSPDAFTTLRDEVLASLDALETAYPPPPVRTIGFGPKLYFSGGFDRYDGGTLNRFVDIHPQQTPQAYALLRNARLRRLIEGASGERFRPHKLAIQLLRHGDEQKNHDIQKDLHRDTFHSAIKVWLFLTKVDSEHGPFAYVHGSHRMTPSRYRWEYENAVERSRPEARVRAGSFRIDESELPKLGLPPCEAVPVAENTLVIADVRGFHRRSVGASGAQRVAIHGSFRRSAFSPVPL